MKVLVAVLICALAFNTTAQNLDLDDKQVVLQVLRGVVEGLAEEAHLNVQEVVECVNDSRVVVQDLIQAVNLIRSNDASNVKEGIRRIGQAIQVLPDAITACKATSQELVQVASLITGLLEQLRHPLRLTFKVGKNLLLNGVEIYHETETAVQDWETQQYEDFGVQVGKILFQLLLKTSTPILEAYTQADQVALQVFVGVLEGFAYEGGIHVEDVQSCVQDTIFAVNSFEGAVRDFSTNDKSRILEGLELLGQGLQTLPSALFACERSVAGAAKLATKLTVAIESLATPQTFAFHIGKDLIVNGRNIYREIRTAVTDWNTQNYHDFGFQVGRAIFDTFVGLQQELNKTPTPILEASTSVDQVALMVFVGVLEGFAYEGGIRVEDVQSCVQDTVSVVNSFEGAVRDFSSNDKTRVLEGLKLLGQGLYALPNAIVDCERSVAEAQQLAAKLTRAIESMATPQTFAFHIGKDLIVNGRNIHKEIRTAVTDWNSQNYHDFGFQVGRALFDTFVGLQEEIQDY